MIIPTDRADRETLYSKLVKDCFRSRGDRKARYDILRNWYLYGNGETQQCVEYNKLFAHIDLLASFLFSGETTSFVIEVPQTDETIYPFEVEKANILTPRVNDFWHDSNTDIVFNDALNLALVFDTMIIKYVPKGKGQFGSYTIRPYSFGVLREDVPTITDQEAMAHEFFMTESELRRKIQYMSPEAQADILSCLERPEDAEDKTLLPGGVQTLIINSTTPTTGEATGQVNINSILMNRFEPVIGENGITCYELWVYDDDLKDHRKVVMVNGEKILHDSEKNTFVHGEVPFVKLTPNGMDDYFWGRSELMYLIPLQEWVNIRVPQIKEILAKLADPPIAGWGLEEKMLEALRYAGGVAHSSDPATMGKVEKYYPTGSSELFRELAEIKEMFNDVSGLSQIMKGGGEPGVRAMGHADMLAKLGASRAKKKAAILEDAAEKYATIILKAMQDYDDTHYRTEKGMAFIAKQLTDGAVVKVDAHSSSPIFIQEQKDTAAELFKTGCYDKEDLVDAMRVQNAEAVKAKIRDREAKEAPLIQIKSLVETAKDDEAVGILAKLKKMFKPKGK